MNWAEPLICGNELLPQSTLHWKTLKVLKNKEKINWKLWLNDVKKKTTHHYYYHHYLHHQTCIMVCTCKHFL